jgi:hypothetical protein
MRKVHGREPPTTTGAHHMDTLDINLAIPAKVFIPKGTLFLFSEVKEDGTFSDPLTIIEDFDIEFVSPRYSETDKTIDVILRMEDSVSIISLHKRFSKRATVTLA